MSTQLTYHSLLVKNKGKTLPLKRTQSGFSLVELLIAGVLGLVLISGVLQLFLGSNQSYRMQDDLAVMQEDGRFVLMYLKEQLQQAGFTQSDTENLLNPVRIAGIALPENIPPVAVTETVDGSGRGNDSVAINYWGDVDCNGNPVPAGAPAINRFYVATNNGINQLMCLGNGGVAQPIISNVESFQVLYGVEVTPNPGCFTGRITGYMTAKQVKDKVAVNSKSVSILSIKTSLLLVSDDDILPEPEQNDYQLLDQTLSFPSTGSDHKTRRIFQQTVFIPNAAWSTLGHPSVFVACGELVE